MRLLGLSVCIFMHLVVLHYVQCILIIICILLHLLTVIVIEKEKSSGYIGNSNNNII